MTRTEQSGRGQHHSRTRHVLCARVYLIKLVLHFSMVKALIPLTSCLSVVGGICSEPSPPPVPERAEKIKMLRHALCHAGCQ